MCDATSPSDHVRVDTWTVRHSLFPPLLVCLLMVAPRDRKWQWREVFALHLFATVVHWQDEWLETHTPYGGEYILRSMWTGDALCESVTGWTRDSPSDAMSGYFGSAGHLCLLACAPMMLSNAWDVRLTAAAAAIFIFGVSRGIADPFEIWSGGLAAVGMFGALLTVLSQGGAYITLRRLRQQSDDRGAALSVPDPMEEPPSRAIVLRVRSSGAP